jgi:hypothetical protein
VSMDHRPNPSELTPEQLRARAAQYRLMAETATTIDTVNGLLKLADRFDGLADKREQEQGN